jgi:hypothetical protein
VASGDGIADAPPMADNGTLWPKLVARASMAPSPHNTQPWLLHPVTETEAELYVPSERTLPHTDPTGAFMTNALGIFVEALDTAAAAEGLGVEADPLLPQLGAGSDARPLFARLRLADRDEPARFSAELLERRRTARGPFDRRPADADALNALQAIAAEAGHNIRFTSEPKLVDWVVGLNADTLFYDLDDDRTRTEIGRWVRRSNAEARRARDGFSPACLGFPGPLVNLFFFHHGLFTGRPARRLVRQLFLWRTRGTSTVGWIQGPWASPPDWYAAGRMFLRFWLELTRQGLYLQPFGSVITNPTAHALMAERLNADENRGDVWLLLRLGYCAVPPRSLRRAATEVLV